MFLKIKKRIELELAYYIQDIDKLYSLSKISPLMFKNIKEFVSRPGKRIRPVLLAAGYLGYAQKEASGLYRTALSLELLHDFMLVHDDIVDKSKTRRGEPSMHAMLNKYLNKYKNLKFNGEDLAIVIADVIYALALHSFLAIKEDAQRKESALKKLIEATFYTASGEFSELLYGIMNIGTVSKADIYRIYDLKTANYTFASPLSIGAILAGAEKEEMNKLFHYGLCLGRAFQIKDDILGLFGEEEKIGKSVLTDLQESKKTLLFWYAYKNSSLKHKQVIKNIFSKTSVTKRDLIQVRNIVSLSGALDFALKEIALLKLKARALNRTLEMHKRYRDALALYTEGLLEVQLSL